METTPQTERPAGKSRTGLVIGLVALLGAGVGVAGIYGMNGFDRNGQTGACPDASSVTAKLAPLAKGEVAAINMAPAPEALPALSFQKPDGSTATLADFKGKTVLLNLWATWCVPCRKEMPALDRLQADLGSATFEVVSVNIDTRNPDRANAFLDEIKVDRLTRYSDHSGKLFEDLKGIGKAFGMPTTVIVDGHGCALADLAGPAEWASDDAKAFILQAMGGSSI